MSKMSKIMLVGLCTFAIVGLMAFSASAGKKGKANWDAKSAKQLEAMWGKMNTAWESGDQAALKAMMMTEGGWGTWANGMDGKPASWTVKETLAMHKEMSAMMKKMGTTYSSKTTSLKCKASGMLGVCMAETTDTMTMKNMPPVTLHHRASATAVKTKDGWKWAHYHGSLAKAPEMPKAFMTISTKTDKWMPAPMGDGVMFSPIAMNPATQASTGLFKAPKGFKQERHFHGSNAIVWVIEGEITHTHPNGKVEKFGPGTGFYQPAKEIHVTEVTKPGVALIMVDGMNTTVYVDEKGNPLPNKQAMK